MPYYCYHYLGQSGTLKRARSDATLCSGMESSENAVCGADVSPGSDVEHSPAPRKRRRTTILEVTCADSHVHSLRDPHVQELFPKHAHEYAPSSSSSYEVVRTEVPTNGSERAIMSPATSQRARRDSELSMPLVGPDSCRALDAHAASSGVQGAAAVLSDAPPPNYHNEPSPPHPASPSSSESSNAYPPELSSRLAAPEGEVTRIEMTFEKLHQELLRSCNHGSLIREVAKRISTSSKWLGSYDAYKEAARLTRFSSGAGFRKNRFMDLMNVIVEEAPRCGLDVPYTHQLRYSRYHYDGSEWNPDSEDGSSKSRDSGTFEGKPSQSVLPVYIMQIF
jgi:hypothetical protein